ncbi:MAG: DUF58 domain-containing protein [Planctomycetes bacterium]|nr:DUF58 domain-containing protein [Planctomycetota bacterium]
MRFGRRRPDNPPVRCRPTKAGWAFLAASALVAVVAVNSGLGLLFVLFGTMLGALYVSAVLARRMIASVGVERQLPSRGRQGRPLTVGYLLRAGRRGGRRGGAALALRVEETDLPENSFLPPAGCGYLPARAGRLVRVTVTPARRGRIRLRAVSLSTTFPFGLVSASRRLRREASVVIWPRRGRLLSRLLGAGEAYSGTTAPSVHAGGQDEFFGLREYRPGDNTRWIHWRRSAGRDEPIIREMTRPLPQKVWIVLETQLPERSERAWELREKAIRFAATVIEDALAAGYRVGAALACGDGVTVLPPGARRSQRRRLLDALADVDDDVACSLDATAAHLRAAWLRQAHVVVVAPSQRQLAGSGAGRILARARSVTFVSAGELDRVYSDEPPRAKPPDHPAGDDVPGGLEPVPAGEEVG